MSGISPVWINPWPPSPPPAQTPRTPPVPPRYRQIDAPPPAPQTAPSPRPHCSSTLIYVHQRLKFLPHSGHLSLLALRSYPHPSHLPSPNRGLRPRTITYPHIPAKNKNTNGRIADAPGSGG